MKIYSKKKNHQQRNTHFLTVFVGTSDSLIQSFRLDAIGAIFRVIESSLAFADRRSILNAVCSLTILYLVCSGRRSFGMLFDGFSNDDGLAGIRTNFLDPIFINDFVLSMAFIRNSRAIGGSKTFVFTDDLIILVRVWILVSANGSATNEIDS